MLGIMAGFVGAFISQFELTGNVSVFSFDSNQILFKFCLGSSKGGVESSQLSVFWCNFTKFGFSNFLSVVGLLKNLK